MDFQIIASAYKQSVEVTPFERSLCNSVRNDTALGLLPFNRLKTEFKLTYVRRFSSYRLVNTVSHESQSVGAIPAGKMKSVRMHLWVMKVSHLVLYLQGIWNPYGCICESWKSVSWCYTCRENEIPTDAFVSHESQSVGAIPAGKMKSLRMHLWIIKVSQLVLYLQGKWNPYGCIVWAERRTF